ncbi:ISL3 family transposase [Nonomuraea sp. 10N515B]|uniref:ISL3 family transposase n=1 Tax=Nonomuraea sp. 10N515B TaxID=3457422 RepID=UPI003FCD774C
MRHECACGEDCCLSLVFPSLQNVEITEILPAEDTVTIITRDGATQAACRSCGTITTRRHGSYRRRLHHDAVEGHAVVVEVEVTRFRCDNPGCDLGTFTAELPGLAQRRQRRTPSLRAVLELVARAAGGRMGSRIAADLGVVSTASRISLIRLLRALPQRPPGEVRTLGVDDFATRRGHTYGTVLVDMDTNTVIDLLTDREADTLAAWLTGHPEVEVICRDRAGAYADGAARGAPNATQVADRFHLWKNLIDYVDKTVARHRADLAEPHPEQDANGTPESLPASAAVFDEALAARRQDGRIVPRTTERHQAVHERLALGHSHSQIARDLGINRATVRRFARAADPEELLVRSAPGIRSSPIDNYTDYLHHRWNQGCHNAAHLTEEIKERGYRGSPQTVRRYLQHFRTTGSDPLPAKPTTPSTRQVTRWLCTHPDRLDPDDQAKFQDILTRSPPLDATAGHVATFAAMLTGRTGTAENLAAWMAAVDADDLPHLHSFTNGLRRDLDAVINGLTLPHSSGAVEGIVNKIKAIKRQMFGRANFDLLKIRILYAI